MKRLAFCIVAAALLMGPWSPGAARGEFRPAERPFIWMNREEIQAARQHLSEPWAEQALRASLMHAGGREVPHYRNFFNILVREDPAATAQEKALLMRFPEVDVRTTPSRENRVLDVIRYDILHHQLTEEERGRIEAAFRRWIHFHLHEYFRGRESVVLNPGEPPQDTRYTRTNWLPNMHHGRALGVFLMAAALQDESLIRACFETPVAGFKWWMDEYLADGRFYMEEFGKMPPTMGEFLLWCRAMRRLGLEELGFGYVSAKSGASMRRYLESWLDIGLPAAPEEVGGRPAFPAIHMGDSSPVSMIEGYAPGERTPNPRWFTLRMLGPAPRMRPPLWFEIMHAEFPDAGYDWYLAQCRMPQEDRYYPSLFFGLAPIDPSKTRPFPVASYVAPERGFGMLRMEESGEYWFSARPTVVLQFGMYYVHYVHDCFTLMHYIAHRRPVYGRRAFGPHRGYAGDHPWIDSVRGHNGVVVDSMQIKPVDDGNRGSRNTRIRHRFAPHVKYLSIFAPARPTDDTASENASRNGLYPDVDVERSLVLTDHYLFDVIRLQSDRTRVYHWNHHPCGQPVEGEADLRAWQPTRDLDNGKLFENMESIRRRHGAALAAGAFDLPRPARRDVGSEAWQMMFSRNDRGLEFGVIIRMLGGGPTVLYRDVDTEVTTLIAERRAPSTLFAVLHEPVVDRRSRIAAFEPILQQEDAMLIRIAGGPGEPVDDMIAWAAADRGGQIVRLEDPRQRWVFRNFTHLRFQGPDVVVTGDLLEAELPDRASVRNIRWGEISMEPIRRDGRLVLKSPITAE